MEKEPSLVNRFITSRKIKKQVTSSLKKIPIYDDLIEVKKEFKKIKRHIYFLKLFKFSQESQLLDHLMSLKEILGLQMTFLSQSLENKLNEQYYGHCLIVLDKSKISAILKYESKIPSFDHAFFTRPLYPISYGTTASHFPNGIISLDVNNIVSLYRQLNDSISMDDFISLVCRHEVTHRESSKFFNGSLEFLSSFSYEKYQLFLIKKMSEATSICTDLLLNPKIRLLNLTINDNDENTPNFIKYSKNFRDKIKSKLFSWSKDLYFKFQDKQSFDKTFLLTKIVYIFSYHIAQKICAHYSIDYSIYSPHNEALLDLINYLAINDDNIERSKKASEMIDLILNSDELKKRGAVSENELTNTISYLTEYLNLPLNKSKLEKIRSSYAIPVYLPEIQNIGLISSMDSILSYYLYQMEKNDKFFNPLKNKDLIPELKQLMRKMEEYYTFSRNKLEEF